MASRPRRAAAQKANTAITDMVDSDNHTSSRTGRTMSSRTSRRSEDKSAVATVSRGPPSSPSDSNPHIHLTVKLPASKLRQATSSRAGQSSRQVSRENFVGGEIIEGKRNRSQKKSYVLDTSDDDDDDDPAAPDGDEDDDEDAEGEDDDMADMDEDDAEGEIIVDDTMDIDADGDEDDEDAEGEDDDDMDLDQIPPAASVIKVSKAPAKSGITSKSKTSNKPPPVKPVIPQATDSDDDEELSELESEADEIQDTVKVGGGDEEDAEGEDDEIEEAEPAEEDDGLGSDDDDSDGEAPDLTKMTKRQRARFEENGDSLMKLSDEVQAKKHFTAEELSMRRSEMARRRRNLSEKRTEEVKMETINKLLKKQAPKISRKAQLLADATPDPESQRANPIFVRWVSNKDGSRVSVPEEMLAGPAGQVFIPGGLGRGKMVEEVS